MLIMYLGHTRFKITQGRPSTANGSLEEAKRRWGKGLPEVGIEEVQSLVPGSQTEAEFSHKTSLLNWANIPKTAKPRQDMDKSGPKDKALQRNRKNKIHRRSKGREQPKWNSTAACVVTLSPLGLCADSPCMAVPPTVTWKEASTALSTMSGSVCVCSIYAVCCHCWQCPVATTDFPVLPDGHVPFSRFFIVVLFSFAKNGIEGVGLAMS